MRRTTRPFRAVEATTAGPPSSFAADPIIREYFYWPTDDENWPARAILFSMERDEWLLNNRHCSPRMHRIIDMQRRTLEMTRAEIVAIWPEILEYIGAHLQLPTVRTENK